jgi:outer membrane receptor protein involved in Fe transport|tara:strand:+ start:9126 stop:12113 length:2988 start_codon:yes stop_codon:yes gene_type:complete
VKKLLFKLTVVSIVILSTSFGGVTGKISGNVKDSSGQPLPGANIILEGTNRGAAADENGFFVILNVTPGAYSITAQMIGYKAFTITGVKVNPDRTSPVDFSLFEEAIAGDEVTVTADKPRVQVDRTFSEYIITSEDIERSVMVKSVGELISLEPGMDIHGRGMIRGGDMNSIAADVTYYVDGVKMISNDGLSLHNYTGVGKYDIESISIITGGLSAEYGNAQAGVVNIVTKEGSDAFHANIEYTNELPGKRHWGPQYDLSYDLLDKMQWDNPEWESEIDSLTGEFAHKKVPSYVDNWGYAIQSNLSGPVTKNISFFLGGRSSNASVNGIGPLTHSSDNFDGTWKLSFYLHPKITFKLGGMYSTSWGFNSGGGTAGVRGGGKSFFLPMYDAAAGKTVNKDQMTYLSFTHMLSEKTYYELRIANSYNKQIPEDTPDSTTEIRTDKDDWFYLPRDIHAFNSGERKRFNVKFDFSTQINPSNLLKTGFDYTDYNVWAFNYRDVLNNRSFSYIGNNHRMESPINPKQFAWYIQDKMEYKGLVLNAGVRLDRFDPNIEYPITTAMGASDFFFDTFTRFNYDSLNSFGLLKKVDPISVWSPRIGVAHPITDRSMIHFFYGHIYQLASFYTLYGEAWSNDGSKDRDINGNGIIEPTEIYNTIEEGNFGNPRLTYEKTISFELGFDWNFYSDYILAVSTFYKSSNNQVTSPGAVQLNWWDPAKQMFDFQFTHMAGNGIHEDIQGFELSLRKQFNKNFGFNLSYNLQWAVEGEAGIGSQFWIPDSSFIVNGNYWTQYATNEDGSENPRSLFPAFLVNSYAQKANTFIDSLKSLGLDVHQLDTTGLWVVEFWGGTEEKPKPDSDIRSYGKAQLFLVTPTNLGPWGIFGDITINMIYKMATGSPFAYSPPSRPLEWRNGPLYTRTDLSLEKIFIKKGNYLATLFVQVSNLFNQRDVRGGGSVPEYIRWGLDKPRPDNAQYIEFGDFDVYSRYHGAPREIKIGLRSSF